ncbi:secreted M23/M37 family peptidase [Flavobacterium columnare]|uniref:M23 family metallopeptidase n=1 Tax=Flavobacterium columnare TaxID=996 RepID=UPI0007F9C004|nr:M23 family metallopeptidase [Flavobacterium columnare]ANO47893.1 secreted M23/M37 family peptidase [Flavobacterium columnare]APT21518.1 peptidase M23 [Flavobacterium columnare]
MIKKFWFIFLIVPFIGICQDRYPRDHFGSPLDIGLNIAGSFGELRPNHFHSGIDFRTRQKEGFPVYATADGFVSRLNVSTYGYGKCLYIDHPNGYTTVYAHLQRFSETIDRYVREKQYADKTFVLELRPKADLLSVKKGDLIGYTGNTGGSSGPHLHFEIRDTKTELAMNPFLFGYDAFIKDTKAPSIDGLYAYALSKNAVVNSSSQSIMIPLTLQVDGTYLAAPVKAKDTIGFAINTHDVSDYNFGKNGIYKLDTFLNGTPYFGYQFDSFSFDESKHINCFIDYSRYKKTHQRFQKLFIGYIFPESIIKYKKNNGLLAVEPNYNLNYKIEIYDFHGNKNTIIIPIEFSNENSSVINNNLKTPYFLKSQIEQLYSKEGISVFIPEQTFYEDFYIRFDVKNQELYLHDESVAISKSMTITFDVAHLPKEAREKMFIANLDGGRIEYNTTVKKEDQFIIKVKKLGKFFIAKDTVAPKIYAPNFKIGEDLTSKDSLKIFISDNLSGIKSYNAYLNNQWILMEYEPKLNRLIHYFSDSKFIDGKNDFKLEVMDNLGNTTTFESNFYKTKA